MGTLVPAIQKVRPEENGLELREVEKPEVAANEVLIRVQTASICGSDLHLFNWDQSIREKLLKASGNFQQGLTIGHEFCGFIEELGSDVNQPGTPQYENLALGDFVSAESHVVCNQCYQCLQGEKHVCVNDTIIGFDRPGAFSPYIALPASCVWKNDPNLPLEFAAIQEPLGNAMHAAAHFPLQGQKVAIFGAGPIGLFCIAIAKAFQAEQIIAIDLNPHRLAIAQKMGAEVILQNLKEGSQKNIEANPNFYHVSSNQEVVEKVKALAGHDGPDVVLEMSGHPDGINNAIKTLRRGGKMVLFGIPRDDRVLLERYSSDLIFKGLSLQAIIGRRIYQTWEQVKVFLQDEKNRASLQPIITGPLPFQDFQNGFEAMLQGKAGKVVLDFQNL